MRVIVLFLFVVLVSVLGNSCPTYLPPRNDATCGFTRDQAYQCIVAHVNTDGDQVISKPEVDAAIRNIAPWYIRALSWFVGTGDVFRDCDYDGNGVVSPRDWEMTADTCLGTPEGRCTFQWFCRCAGDQ